MGKNQDFMNMLINSMKKILFVVFGLLFGILTIIGILTISFDKNVKKII